MTTLENTARDVILNLLEARDFMGYQLSHANGGMTDEELDVIVEKYLKPSRWDKDELQTRVEILGALIGDRLDMDVISVAFGCSLEEARQAVAQIQADASNKKHPSGTPVIRTDDFGKEHETVTRSEAWALCGSAVVKVDGYSGGYLLDRIRPRKEADSE